MQIQQNLIHDGITGPFPVAYDAGFGGFMITNCFSKPVNENSTDFASACAQNVGAAETAVRETYDKFMENLENGN